MKDAVYAATRLPGLHWMWDLAARSDLRAAYRSVNTVPSSAVIPPPAARTLLELRERFASEVRELEVMIDRPLAKWLPP